MPDLLDIPAGGSALLMGNEAVVRGALEAGIQVAAGYPGTPSSEIIDTLSRISRQRNIYVEWSVNEKVATEVAAAASYAELRALVAMKQVGMNVAADFLLHLSLSGTRGGLVLVSCEDPGALSSTNEEDSRPYAKMMEFPLLEIGDFQDAKDLTKWAFDLSETIQNIVMVRSVARISHSIGVICGEQTYPFLEELKGWIRELLDACWFLDTTEAAVKLGNPILGNTVCVGALAATGELPLNREVFKAVVSQKLSSDHVELNLSAYDMGEALIKR
jgi:TPP-dependent indolepyruvate ferredoxin oxidoreductase alpha subunit